MYSELYFFQLYIIIHVYGNRLSTAQVHILSSCHFGVTLYNPWLQIDPLVKKFSHKEKQFCVFYVETILRKRIKYHLEYITV